MQTVIISYTEKEVQDDINCSTLDFDFKGLEAEMVKKIHEIAPDAKVVIDNLDALCHLCEDSVDKGSVDVQDDSMSEAEREALTQRFVGSLDKIDLEHFNHFYENIPEDQQ
jgi:thymidine kinase